MTAAELFLRNPESDEIAAHFEDRSYSRAGARRRVAPSGGALGRASASPSAPPHIGVLLDNTAEYLFWLGAAAITRSVVVGINSTYRGAELAQLDRPHRLPGARDVRRVRRAARRGTESRSPTIACFVTGTAGYAGARWRPSTPITPATPRSSDDLYLLIFTSGSTGLPEGGALHAGPLRPERASTWRRRRPRTRLGGVRAVAVLPLQLRCSPGWRARSRRRCRSRRERGSRRHARCPTSVAPGATMLAYTGKVLNYILAVPPSPDDASSPLEFAFGNEASESDIRDVRGAVRLPGARQLRLDRGNDRHPARRVDAAPARSAAPTTTSRCTTPRRGRECPRAEFDAAGRLLNADAAVGEIVNTEPADTFEGYYRNEEAHASKVRDGIYWSGDLAYRDADGWFFFAGRSNEWLRVDGENFAAGPVERIVLRHPAVRSAAVYAVPDDPGRRPRHGRGRGRRPRRVRRRRVRRFRAPRQPDLGPKWVPSFVRVDGGAAEAGEHEARQVESPPRGLGRPGRQLATETGRAAAADDGRPTSTRWRTCCRERVGGSTGERRGAHLMTIDDAGLRLHRPQGLRRRGAVPRRLRAAAPGVAGAPRRGRRLHAVLGGDQARRRDGDRARIGPLAQRAPTRRSGRRCATRSATPTCRSARWCRWTRPTTPSTATSASSGSSPATSPASATARPSWPSARSTGWPSSTASATS